MVQSLDYWFEVGRKDGVAAGETAITVRSRSFSLFEERLAFGHNLLNGAYNEICRRVSDFGAVEHGEAWMNGVLVGIESVKAWPGFVVQIEDPADSSLLIYVLVSQWPAGHDPMLN
ncbi:hypothetical protein V9K92_14870 [Phyllobacterium sp. CCNWLW109]|uniref:hypothetical protein n=1 Tax=Phyllobacterium sp. CCNWLW109 TaxID=3127479 RepID=UPI00307834E5